MNYSSGQTSRFKRSNPGTKNSAASALLNGQADAAAGRDIQVTMIHGRPKREYESAAERRELENGAGSGEGGE